MIDLHKLPPEGLRLNGTTEQVALEGGVSLRDLTWSVFALASDGDVFLEVKGQAVWQGACSRCLAPLDRPIMVESQFLGSKDPELVGRGAHTLGTQDLDVVFLPEDAPGRNRAGAGAVRAPGSHAPPLCRGLQGPLPHLRQELEQGPLPVPA